METKGEAGITLLVDLTAAAGVDSMEAKQVLHKKAKRQEFVFWHIWFVLSDSCVCVCVCALDGTAEAAKFCTLQIPYGFLALCALAFCVTDQQTNQFLGCPSRRLDTNPSYSSVSQSAQNTAPYGKNCSQQDRILKQILV